MKTEKEALEILKKYTTKPNLIKHAIVVGAVLKHFAQLQGEDAEYWNTVGLLHDVDYEMYPEEHCFKLVEILKDEGFDDKFIRAIQSHGYEICTDVEPISYMEKILCTIDQLSGFIIACALIRPEKKLEFVDLKSIHKRWKIPSFAAGTERGRIESQTTRWGLDFDYIATETLKAMQAIAGDIGL